MIDIVAVGNKYDDDDTSYLLFCYYHYVSSMWNTSRTKCCM